MQTPPKKSPKAKDRVGEDFWELYGIKSKLVEKDGDCDKDMNLAAELLFQSYLFAETDTDVTIHDEVAGWDEYVRGEDRRLVRGEDRTDQRFKDWDLKMEDTQALVRELRSETKGDVIVSDPLADEKIRADIDREIAGRLLLDECQRGDVGEVAGESQKEFTMGDALGLDQFALAELRDSLGSL